MVKDNGKCLNANCDLRIGTKWILGRFKTVVELRHFDGFLVRFRIINKRRKYHNSRLYCLPVDLFREQYQPYKLQDTGLLPISGINGR